MKKSRLAFHRERLLALQARLQGDISQMADAALNKDHNKTPALPTDLAELGTESFIQELTLSLLGNERQVLDQIHAALERTQDGTFGQCGQCGKKIPEARLEALPYAALCVLCASREEAG